MFYSRYLGGSKAKASPSPRARAAGPRNAPSQRAQGGSLVWHSGTGASHSHRGAAGSKPLGFGYNPRGKRKQTVHFSTIEVQPFHFDWDLADQIFYTRAELTVMGQSRFDDAATLRQQRNLDAAESRATDDVELSTKSKEEGIARLLDRALGDEDLDENVSIRGIEHFVYPALQQEMIRRKKEVQKEVLGFVRSKRPNPQGWKLAEHSRKYSQWARNVATEKGLKYQMNSAVADPGVEISEAEHDMLQKSQDSIDKSQRSIRGSASFPEAGSASFDKENSKSRNASYDPLEVNKNGGSPDQSCETQPAGADTGED